MARYFAEIKDGIVQRVVVCESKEWLEERLGGEWVETFMNSKDKHYAGKGYTYHPDKTNFARPRPYPSWTLNEKLDWEPPVPEPEPTFAPDGRPEMYYWNEPELKWEKDVRTE